MPVAAPSQNCFKTGTCKQFCDNRVATDFVAMVELGRAQNRAKEALAREDTRHMKPAFTEAFITQKRSLAHVLPAAMNVIAVASAPL